MEPERRDVLVINDAGLAGLTACLMHSAPEGVVVWSPPEGSALLSDGGEVLTQDRSVLLSRQADVLGFARVIEREAIEPESGRSGGVGLGIDLLRAVADAVALGCEAVVWPIVSGDDLDRLFEAAECSQLVTRLASLERLTAAFADSTDRSPTGPAPEPVVRVETPFIDLTPAQVSEMADDLDAPRELCWELEGGQTPAADRPA